MAGSYKVKGAGAVFAHNGKVYKEGDTVEDVPRAIALEFQYQLEPVDASDAFPEQGITVDVSSLAPHEQKIALEERKKALTMELQEIEKQLSQVGKTAPQTQGESADASTAGIPVK